MSNGMNEYEDHLPGGVSTINPEQQGVSDYNPAERAAEAEVRAMVEARCIMAFKRPRNLFQCRAKIMEACARPTFAETAIYRKPVGKKDGVQQFAEGPSIRFAEEAYRGLGNLWSSLTVQFENAEKRVLRFDLMDLESNNTDSTIITVAKTVERSFLKQGQVAISSRMNSYGKVAYLVEATDDDLQVKQGAMVAKARRDAIIRALPSDVKEDAMEKVKKTLANRDAQDQQGALKRLMDAFQSEFRIMPDQIEKYLGHEIAIVTPGEIQSLRGVFNAIKDGDSNWAEVIKSVEEDREGSMKASAEKAAAKQAAKAGEKPQGDSKDASATNAPGTPASPAQAAKDRARGAAEKMAGTEQPQGLLPSE